MGVSGAGKSWLEGSFLRWVVSMFLDVNESSLGCFSTRITIHRDCNFFISNSTIGQMLSKAVNIEFLDADDFHPPANKEKMHHGIPLSDEDRAPWLQLLRHTLLERLCRGRSLILACSALQEHYREILRSADPDYKLGSFSCRVKFVLLDVGPEVLAARLEARAAEGKHFMPPSLLQSQLDLLRIHDAEGVFKVNAALSPQAILSEIEYWLGPTIRRNEVPTVLSAPPPL